MSTVMWVVCKAINTIETEQLPRMPDLSRSSPNKIYSNRMIFSRISKNTRLWRERKNPFLHVRSSHVRHAHIADHKNPPLSVERTERDTPSESIECVWLSNHHKKAWRNVWNLLFQSKLFDEIWKVGIKEEKHVVEQVSTGFGSLWQYLATWKGQFSWHMHSPRVHVS